MGKNDDVFICRNCLTLSTRPRVQFTDGVCNACVWAEEKKSLDWDSRWKYLEQLCDKYRDPSGGFDVVVPCSGGKDGSYVAFKLRDDLGMHPLCVTFKPQLQTDIGRHNLEAFKDAGFDHITITPDPDVYRRFSRHTFVSEGRPVQPFTMGISTSVLRTALAFGIPFIMYGEEGEQEYGGATSQIGRYLIDKDYLVNYYYSGHSPESYLEFFNRRELQWWMLPGDEELRRGGLFVTHWSHFENWDSLSHYNYIQERYDFRTCPQVGTFTDYGQLDCLLHELQVYLMKIKFGFGRCWADVCIMIRGGYMSRDDGIELVRHLDGLYPWHNHQSYLDYFDMSDKDFWKVVDGFRPSSVWRRDGNGGWLLRFDIK